MRVSVTLFIVAFPSISNLYDNYLELIIISSFSLITNRKSSARSVKMLQKKSSSLSSVTTSAFETISIQTNDSEEKALSLFYSDLMNINHNAIDINNDYDKDKTYSPRYAQSSTDLITNIEYSLSSKLNEIRSKASTAIRIESALLTSTCSPYTTQSITMDRNMNQTIDLIDRTGAGDESIPTQVHDKQVQTINRTDTNDYLPLELVSIEDRRTRHHRLKSKRFLFISTSILICLILLILTTIFFVN